MKSRVQFVVKGLNQERAFNQLLKQVQILKLDRADKQTCCVEVRPKDAKKTQSFFKNNNFEIVSITRFGVNAVLSKLKKCYGILAGILLMTSLYFVQKGFVWRICVFGQQSVDTDELIQFIDENLPSKWIANIDTQEIEIAIKDNFDKISSVSVAVIGQSLVINLVEAVVPNEMSEFNSIVCQYDCQISSIELIQGTLNVHVGDVVRAGQVLVEPYIIDSQGERRNVRPLANIKADVWIIGTSEHNESYLKTYRTGKEIEFSRVLLFGIEIYSHGGNVPFSQYESEQTIQDLSKNNILPLKIEKTRFYETKTELVESKFEEKKDEVIELARQNALQNVGEYEIIKQEYYSIKTFAGVTVVNYVLTVEREIGGC